MAPFSIREAGDGDPGSRAPCRSRRTSPSSVKPSRRSSRSRAEGSGVRYGFSCCGCSTKKASARDRLILQKRPDPPRRVAFPRLDLDDLGAAVARGLCEMLSNAGLGTLAGLRVIGDSQRTLGMCRLGLRYHASSLEVMPKLSRASKQTRHKRRVLTISRRTRSSIPWRNRRFSC